MPPSRPVSAMIDPSTMLLKCLRCPERFPGWGSIKSHYSSEHSEHQEDLIGKDAPRFTCIQCSNKYMQKANLEIHLITCNQIAYKALTGKDIITYYCTMCDTTTPYLPAIRRHYKGVHLLDNVEEAVLKTPTTASPPQAPSSSTTPSARATATQERHKCSECKKLFRRKWKYIDHMRESHDIDVVNTLPAARSTSTSQLAPPPPSPSAACPSSSSSPTFTAAPAQASINPIIAASPLVKRLLRKIKTANKTLEDVGTALSQNGAYIAELFNGQREATTEDLQALAEMLEESLNVLKFVFFLGRGWQRPDW